MNAANAGLAVLWGIAAASGLLIGAALGIFAKLSPRVVAGVMAFGSGILISAIAFDLMDDAFNHGGLAPAAIGFLAGAGIFTAGSLTLRRVGIGRMKRAAAKNAEQTALTIALGTLIDAIPESLIIGMTVAEGSAAVIPFAIAVFASNIPEALSSSAAMKEAGHGPLHAFALWGGIAVASAGVSVAGYALSGLPPEWVALTQGIGAGALLALIADCMIPEAFAESHDWAGFIAAFGFLAGFVLSHGLA